MGRPIDVKYPKSKICFLFLIRTPKKKDSIKECSHSYSLVLTLVIKPQNAPGRSPKRRKISVA